MKLHSLIDGDFQKAFDFIITIQRKYGETILHAFVAVVKCIFVQSYKLKMLHKAEYPQIVFIDSNERNDYVEFMANLSRLCGADTYANINFVHCQEIHLLRTIRTMKLLALWTPKILQIQDYSLVDRLAALKKCSDFYDIKQQLDHALTYDNINLCVVRYDACSDHNFISQLFSTHNITTATLQHGIMLAPRKGLEDNLDFNGTEFRLFVSDYFLVWNDFTKREAIKAGIPEEKIKTLGVVKCIGMPPIEAKGKRAIGVILDGEFEKENNPPMLRLVKDFCRDFGYKYILRYHPNFNGSEYDSLLDINGSVCSKSTNLADYLRDIEFCVVANSTVLFELEYYGIPFMNYSSGSIKDKYKDYTSHKFSNYEEMKQSFNGLKTALNSHNTDYAKLYKDFFLQWCRDS
ncbi:MAG: hypothetical protein K6G73_06315 [Marinilabiliaceae bacterium]|nr:hypothetical protein [Marinilabiliaceae bacterium]